MNSLDIIVPYIDRDRDRFILLWKSIQKYLNIPDFKLYLVSPNGKSPINSKNIISIKETDLDPQLNIKRYCGQGWWKQQIIKLSSYKICSSDYILSVDCDCFLNKKFGTKDYLKSNKCRLKITNSGSWDNWYQGSADILHLPFDKSNKIGVTPFIFSRKILEGLDKYLTLIYGKDKTAVLLEHSLHSKENGLSPVWTEYCLYHIYAQHNDLLFKYHILDNNFVLYDNCFWNEKEADAWDPSISFKNPNHFFTVAQSVANKSGSWVYNKVKKYIDK